MRNKESLKAKYIKNKILEIVIDAPLRKALVLEIAMVLMSTICTAMMVINAVSGYWELFYTTLAMVVFGLIASVIGWINVRKRNEVIHQILS